MAWNQVSLLFVSGLFKALEELFKNSCSTSLQYAVSLYIYNFLID